VVCGHLITLTLSSVFSCRHCAAFPLVTPARSPRQMDLPVLPKVERIAHIGVLQACVCMIAFVRVVPGHAATAVDRTIPLAGSLTSTRCLLLATSSALAGAAQPVCGTPALLSEATVLCVADCFVAVAWDCVSCGAAWALCRWYCHLLKIHHDISIIRSMCQLLGVCYHVWLLFDCERCPCSSISLGLVKTQ